MSDVIQIGRYQVSGLVECGDDLEFKFHLPSDGNCTIINKLRQIIKSDIPTPAIDLVEITTNTSDLQDEVLSHRLNLIPIRKLDDSEPYITLEIGPFSHSYEVTSKDLKSKGYIPLTEDIIICKLKRGQEIKLKANVKNGTGGEHSKWTPIIHFTYKLDEKNCYNVQMTSLGTASPTDLLKTGLMLMDQ
jgi:DNA-directed RNA polymerase II subunit RPB3